MGFNSGFKGLMYGNSLTWTCLCLEGICLLYEAAVRVTDRVRNVDRKHKYMSAVKGEYKSNVLDFKLSLCSECCILSFGRFPDV